MAAPSRHEVILALDSGSQSSRALLFDSRGRVLARGQRAHAPMLHPEPGAVEQDPQDIRACLFGSVRDALEGWGGDARGIVGAALTTQRNVTLALDADGQPLRDAISWLDRRTADPLKVPSLPLRALFRLLGDEAIVSRLLCKSVPRQWQQRDPELLEQVRHVVPLEAWLHHELTGELATAPGGLIGVWPMDMRGRTLSEQPLMHRLLGFQSQWLPRVVEVGQEVGAITAAAAVETGLPEGLPLFAVGGDKQAEALGAGVRLGGWEVFAVSLGTASSVTMAWPQPTQSRSYRWITNVAAEPGAWALEYMVFRGMWTAAWFARNFARDLEQAAQEAGLPVEALLVREAEAAPAGADGLMIWPRWSPSIQHPEEAGTLVGLRETHSRGHVFRALLEGIAYDLRRGADILRDATGADPREVRVGGGGARSDLVVQIVADVLGLPVRRPPMAELSALGAAVVAGVGAGMFGDFDTAVEAMVSLGPLVQPDPSRRAVYDRAYAEAYEPGLSSLREMWRALHPG